MNWNTSIRQTHRWISAVFTVIVMGLFIALGLGREPPQWVYFLPLAPLAVLVLSGVDMFALPYIRRGGRGPA